MRRNCEHIQAIAVHQLKNSDFKPIPINIELLPFDSI